MNKLIALSIVRNEKDRYLEEWLANVARYADYHIILDDCSDDGTWEILQEYKKKYEPRIRAFQIFDESIFKTNEVKLRNALWEIVRQDPNSKDAWIIVVDADEFYDEELIQRRQELLNLPTKYDVVAFKLCDMWSEYRYRTDGYWSPYFHRMFRFEDEPFTEELKEGLHHPSIPGYAINSRNVFNSEIKCRHRSYENYEAKVQKYGFYKQNSKSEFDLEHARSILEVEPTLKPIKKELPLPKILVASLVRNREWILPNFLKCLANIDYPKNLIEYYFIVNNSLDGSERLLGEFARNGRTTIDIYNFADSERHDHTWDANLLKHMAHMRNMHLCKAEEVGAEYLISIDSDILFPPQVVKHLVLSQREIISPVFWAGWSDHADGHSFKMPQVWERGGYELSDNFIHMLKAKRGLFQVGGLGAFTAIHRSVWEQGVNYNRITNLPDNMNGEDRDFCVCAKAHGFNLWASTYYDLIHVDNLAMLNSLKEIKK